MVKIAALTSGSNIPSARFRIRQYLPYLRNAGIDVTEYCPLLSQGARLPGALGRVRTRYFPPLLAGQMLVNLAFRVPGVLASHVADVTWLERNFVPGLDDCAALLRSPIVLDIDDAIWLYNPLGSGMIKRLVRRADMVFAGNQFLANWCSECCQNVQIIPTAVDADRFRPRTNPKPENSPFVVGWTGTAGNFRFLQMIEPALARFLGGTPSARLLVVADRAPDLTSLPPGQVDFVAWNPSTEHLVLHEMDVGIMPIDDSDLSKGKCSFKMLQYMAAGIPVIASPFGMNIEIFAQGEMGFPAVTQDDWVESLQDYCDNVEIRRRHGESGRKIIENKYAADIVANGICKIFQDYFD